MIIVCALLGGIVWNLITWWLGLPSSSTHALVGGLCGAALASSRDNWHSIIWTVEKVKDGKVVVEGVIHKVVVPMISSPIIGFFGGLVIMGLLYALLRSARPRFVNRFFGKAQIVSAAFMGFAHGLADAQKTMGVITLALVTATATGTFVKLPDFLCFLRMDKSMTSEQSILTIQNAQSTPEQLSQAAIALESEADKLKPGEFREAFLTLSAKTQASLSDVASAKRLSMLAEGTHRELIDAENARTLPKVPVLGGMVAAKFTDWEKTLSKDTLTVAAGKVHDLSPDVPTWIKVLCSLTMAAGTMGGGWRIIKTLGHKIVKLQPVHGFAAETAAAILLVVTGSLGMTVSTTHSITSAIMGVGCAKRFNALKFSLVERIIWAWILTLPAAGFAGYIFVNLFRLCGWVPS